MSNTPQTAQISWRDGTIPIADAFDDPYFSLNDGLAETRHVFLAGNDLPARFTPGFRIAELGFGTGLNLLAAWKAWDDAGTAGPLHFTSFEAFPIALEDMEKSLSCWPELSAYALEMLAALSRNPEVIDLPSLKAQIIVGDARETLANWQDCADAWFLDGFSPAKNPELWQPDLMVEVGAHTSVGGSFATYTAAGHVRQSLTDAGFEVERISGFGRKRHMTRGTKRSAP